MTGFLGGAMAFGLRAYAWNWPVPAAATQAATTGPTSQAAGIIVTMTDDDVFVPAKITIEAGTTVVWHSVSTDVHDVTTDPTKAMDPTDVSSPAGVAPFASGDLKQGATFKHTFTVPGVYKYVCAQHEAMGMTGEVDVKPASPKP